MQLVPEPEPAGKAQGEGAPVRALRKRTAVRSSERLPRSRSRACGGNGSSRPALSAAGGSRLGAQLAPRHLPALSAAQGGCGSVRCCSAASLLLFTQPSAEPQRVKPV